MAMLCLHSCVAHEEPGIEASPVKGAETVLQA